MIHKTQLTFILLILVLLFGSLTPHSEKKKAIQLYQHQYLSTSISEIPWNGSIPNCDPGNLNPDIVTKAEKRINYFRKVTGLQTIELLPEYNEKAQRHETHMSDGRIGNQFFHILLD